MRLLRLGFVHAAGTATVVVVGTVVVAAGIGARAVVVVDDAEFFFPLEHAAVAITTTHAITTAGVPRIRRS
jgi:hypothetical protein